MRAKTTVPSTLGRTAVFAVLSLGLTGVVPAVVHALGDEIVSAVLPLPRHVAARGNDFHLTERTVIVDCGRDQADEDFGLCLFQRYVEERFGLRLKRGKITGADELRDAIVAGDARRDPLLECILRSKGLETSDDIGQEGYQLWVADDAVIVHANTSAGLFYGIATLKQLVYQSRKGPAVKAVEITDYPRYRLRGLQFDAGRCPQSIAMMKRMIRICSLFKLNFAIFREGDDELNAVRYKSNKLGSLNPRAISTEEMAELIRYAHRYHIRIIPEVESLGHSAAKGFHYPDLLHPGGRRQKYEGIGIHLRKRRLVLENPQTYELLRSIYSEWVPMLASPYIHLGCDEAGRGTGEHLARLTSMLNELGREHCRTIRPIVWADAAPTPEALKGQVIRCLWAYGESGGREIDVSNKFLNVHNQGVKELAEPGCREEVLMAGGSDSYHTPLAKAEYENALPNIYSWCQFGKDKLNFIGIFAVQWSGNQHDLWLPDDLTVAEYGWTPDKPTFDFEKCMRRIKESLSKVKDYTDPRPEEVDRPCWDGIWLTEDDKWGQDIMGRAVLILQDNDAEKSESVLGEK